LMAVEEDTWQTLPIDLQEKFYEEAEQGAEELLRSIEETKESIESVRPIFSPYFLPLPKSCEFITVAAVDGSRSVRPVEKLGARFAVFSVGMLVVKGLERLGEPYYDAGRMQSSPAKSRDHLLYELSLTQVLKERMMALEALKMGVQLVIIDGSFLGFLYEALHARRGGILEADHDLERKLKEAYDATRNLIESRRCVAVIKRSRTRALGGWLSYQQKKRHQLVDLLDKHILALLMDGGVSFRYDQLLKEPAGYRVYSRLAERVREKGSMDWEKELEEARRWVVERHAKALGIPQRDAEATLHSLARMQVKPYAEVAPFELEYPVGMDRELLSSFLGNPVHFSEATGLPMALDMVDELVSVPRGFTRDFAEEMEARIMERYRGEPGAVRVFFQNLNPQKEF
jgi:hypothetical protein